MSGSGGGARVSMSAKGNPYDNAKAESSFKTLKREEVYMDEYRTYADAQANIGRFDVKQTTTPNGCTRAGPTCPRSNSKPLWLVVRRVAPLPDSLATGVHTGV